MGWAKYYEDNNEIINDRIYDMTHDSCHVLSSQIIVNKLTFVEKKEVVLVRRVCKCCGEYFDLTKKEIKYYTRKNWHLPTHCRDCRETRRVSAKVTDKKSKVL